MSASLKFCLSFLILLLPAQTIHAQSQDTTEVSFPVELLLAPDFSSKNEVFSAEEFNETINPSQDKPALISTGKLLTYIGIPLMLTGILLARNAPNFNYECFTDDCSGSLAGSVGANLIIHGASSTTTGIVLWSVGRKKKGKL